MVNCQIYDPKSCLEKNISYNFGFRVPSPMARENPTPRQTSSSCEREPLLSAQDPVSVASQPMLGGHPAIWVPKWRAIASMAATLLEGAGHLPCPGGERMLIYPRSQYKRLETAQQIARYSHIFARYSQNLLHIAKILLNIAKIIKVVCMSCFGSGEGFQHRC